MTATVLLEVPFSARGDRIPDAVAELRTREPIRKVRTITGAEAWLVSSYALCTQVLEDRRFSMKETAAAGAPRLNALTVPPEVVNNMGNIADAGLRKAVMKAITPKAPGLEQFLRDTANSLLDNLITEGAPADLRNDFADPLATALHCKVLGIPQEDGPKLFRSLSIAFMSSADPIPAAKINWDRDIEYMAGILENPNITTGLMGELSRLRKDPAYSHVSDELFATIGVTFFGAGVISTGSFLTTALISLIQRPQLRNLLHEKPELIPAGVEDCCGSISPSPTGYRAWPPPTSRSATCWSARGSWCWCCSRAPTSIPSTSLTRAASNSTGPTPPRTSRSAAANTSVLDQLSVAATHRSASKRC